MTFFRSLLLLCPAAFLLAQTPPTPPPANATPVPKSTFPVAAPPAEVPPDTVVLTVGDVKLTARQLDLIVDSLPEQARPMYRGPGRKNLGENLAKVLVLDQEGKKRGLDQTPGYKTQVMFQMANILAGLAFAEINKDVKVDDAAVKKYYEEHKGDYEEVHARHILIRMQGSPVPVKAGQKDLTEAEALSKAQDLKKQIDGGADFAELAKKESDDTGSGANGGDLGTFHHGMMVGPFDQAAFTLEVGKVSDPVKSQFGYHIIRVESKTIKGLDEVKADIEKKMKPQEAQKAVEDLQKKANVVMDPTYFGLAKQ